MRRIALWVMSTMTVVLLMFGYHTSTSGTLSADLPPAVVGGSSTTGDTTVTGSVAQTRWGPVRVAIDLNGGEVTDVSVVQYPNGNPHDQEINSSALPVLISETLDAQSADIDMVSGATVTSVGYQQSLQSALDQAGL